ncbi:MAG TPA: Fic family protein [Humisphaera sp.]|nr:Fic family protein [Humisphaera sp.]
MNFPPDWDEDIPPGRLAEFRALVGHVHQEILATAARAVLASDDPCRWHGALFRTLVPLHYYAGNYRGDVPGMPCLAILVWVGGIPGSDYPIVRQHIDFVFESARVQIGALELRWPQLDSPERASQLATIVANLVGGFIRIHPFVNGNGRISRFLWRWCLMRFGVPVQCCVHPRPDPPYGQLMHHAMRGDYRPLALFVLTHLSAHAPRRN